MSMLLDKEAEGRTAHVPFPLDHFFFCFLPPVAAGAYVVAYGLSVSNRFSILLSPNDIVSRRQHRHYSATAAGD